MSNAIFPVFPGQGWNTIKTPEWKTQIQKSVSGRELRLAYYNIPLYHFTLTYEVLRSGTKKELEQIMAFFNLRKGSFDSFLYNDPTDNSTTNMVIGIGDGSNKKFQLLRTMSGSAEPVFAPNTYAVYINNVLTTAYSMDVNTGIITFNNAPAAGASISWTGTFYYRCRFAYDSIDFENFMQDLWVARKVEFISVKP